MPVCLRNRVAMAMVLQHAFAIGFDDSRVSICVMLLKPTQQSGAKIETDVRVVINDSIFAGHNVGEMYGGVSGVAFGMNALVPIVKRSGAGLFFDDSSPRIFAWRLVEVAVNDQEGHF